MTTLATDTYNRTDQTNWGTASNGQSWTYIAGTSGNSSIAGNEGQIGTTQFDDTVLRIGSGVSASIDALVKIRIGGGNGGLVWRLQDADNYYRAVQEDGGTLYLQVRSGGSFNTITSTGIGGWSTASYWWMHVTMSGNAITVTVWLDGTSEPGPQISTTDATITSAGGYGVASVAYTTGQVNSFDDLTITDGSTTTTGTRTVPNSVVLLQTSARSVPDTAVLVATNTRTVPDSAVLLETRTRAVPDQAVLLETRARTVPDSAALQQTATRTVPSDATLSQSGTRAVPDTAVLKATSRRTVPNSAVLAGISVAPPTNAIVYVRSGQATAYVRSGDAIVYVRKP